MAHLQFDDVTGIELESSLESRSKTDGLELIREAAAFAQLKGLPGWQILEKFINSTVEGLKDKLLLSKDFDEIRRIQEHVGAYLNVLTYVDAVIAQGDQVRAEYEALQTAPEMDPPSESPDVDNPT
jgi:hypothetical protein